MRTTSQNNEMPERAEGLLEKMWQARRILGAQRNDIRVIASLRVAALLKAYYALRIGKGDYPSSLTVLRSGDLSVFGCDVWESASLAQNNFAFVVVASCGEFDVEPVFKKRG